MTDRELMQQALDALKVMRPACFAETTLKSADTAIAALRDRLAQPEQTLTCVCGAVWEGELMVHAPRDRLAKPEQKPVVLMDAPLLLNGQPLYTTPPQRPWAGLTDEDMAELRRSGLHAISDTDFRAIEAKLKEKNT